MVTAIFRFYEELNDFLAPERRGHEFAALCARAASTKHMIEALGVPHTEVELVLVNGESVGFERILRDGDRGKESRSAPRRSGRSRTRPSMPARLASGSRQAACARVQPRSIGRGLHAVAASPA